MLNIPKPLREFLQLNMINLENENRIKSERKRARERESEREIERYIGCNYRIHIQITQINTCLMYLEFSLQFTFCYLSFFTACTGRHRRWRRRWYRTVKLIWFYFSSEYFREKKIISSFILLVMKIQLFRTLWIRFF